MPSRALALESLSSSHFAMPVLFEFESAHDAVNVLARDTFVEKITPNETQRTTLIVAGCYVVVIAILWCAAAL